MMFLRHKGMRWFGAAVIVGSFVLLFQRLFADWDTTAALAGLSWQGGWLPLSVIAGSIAVIGYGLVWYLIVRQLDHATSLTIMPALRIYALSAVTKYIPTSVVLFVSRAYLLMKAGSSRPVSVASVVYETALSVVAQLIFASCLLLSLSALTWPVLLLIGVLLLWALILWRAGQLGALVNKIVQRVGGDQATSFRWLTVSSLAWVILSYLVISAFFGFGFVALVHALLPSAELPTIALMGMFIFAGVTGTLVFFVPGGLGVREGMLAAFLSLLMPVGTAVFIALAARIWATVLEVVVYGTLMIISRSSPAAASDVPTTYEQPKK